MTECVIACTNLTRKFGELTAVDSLSLQVQAGEIFGFLGHNGAGKTTTVRLLNGILNANAGEVRVLGLDPAADGAELRRRSGVLTESPSLDERLTAREMLEIYARVYGLDEKRARSRVVELLKAFELLDRADEKLAGFSKGMKQRMALVRALLHSPEVLYLDEPSAGLDPVSTRGLHELILRLSREQGRTIFLCTHNLMEAQKLCNRVGVMEHGKLIALGTPAELSHRLVHGAKVEIEVQKEQAAAAQEVIKNQFQLVSEPGQNGTLVVTALHHEKIPAVLAALVQAQVNVYRVAAQEPTLEDAYFALHTADRE